MTTWGGAAASPACPGCHGRGGRPLRQGDPLTGRHPLSCRSRRTPQLDDAREEIDELCEQRSRPREPRRLLSML